MRIYLKVKDWCSEYKFQKPTCEIYGDKSLKHKIFCDCILCHTKLVAPWYKKIMIVITENYM